MGGINIEDTLCGVNCQGKDLHRASGAGVGSNKSEENHEVSVASVKIAAEPCGAKTLPETV